MYKRVLSEAPSTPSKRANQARFVISPIKQTYQNNSTTYVREIRDPIDHSLIAVTFEGVYDLRSFFNGYDTVKMMITTMSNPPSVVWKAILYIY